MLAQKWHIHIYVEKVHAKINADTGKIENYMDFQEKDSNLQVYQDKFFNKLLNLCNCLYFV